MPTLRSNAITQNGATMSFFSFTGIRLAEPVSQINQGRLETTLVETIISRPDSEEGIWAKQNSDSTSQEKHFPDSVFLMFGGDSEAGADDWYDVITDDDGDETVHVSLTTSILHTVATWVKFGALQLRRLPNDNVTIDSDGDIRIILPGVPYLPASSFEEIHGSKALLGSYFFEDGKLTRFDGKAWVDVSFQYEPLLEGKYYIIV
jgi:hypothetical protein